jgi:uncharacterized protein YjbJ (UPF0337 family)
MIASSVRPRRLRAPFRKLIGKALGDAKLQADGKSDTVAGRIQNAIGGLKDALKQ